MKKEKEVNNKQSMHGPTIVPNEKVKDIKKTIKNLLSYIKPYRISIIIVLIFAFFSSAFAITGPKILGRATTKLFEGIVSKITGAGAGIDFGYISKILLILVGLYITSALFSFIQGFIMAGVTQKVSFNLRKAISRKINKMPLKFFDKHTHGEILSRVTNDVDLVSQTLSQSMSDTVTSITTIIGVLIMMLSINVVMTLISLIIIPISMILIMFVVKKSQTFFTKQQAYVGKINGYVEESYSGHNIIKVFNRKESSIKEFDNINDKLYGMTWKAHFLSGLMMPVMTFVGNLGYVTVSILGGWLTIKNKIEVGDILAFIQYTRSFMQPIRQAASIASTFQSTLAAAERVFEFLDSEEEPSDKKSTIDLKKVKGKVEFKNVNFGYEEDKTVINAFSASILPGQNVAIVGPTGAGKTTIVKLLMRFYDVNKGSILLDDTDIKDISKKDLRSILGMVLQDTWLFNGTIMDNIRYGKLDASDEEVIKAAKAAHVDHFIHTLPDNYNTVINEEADNISIGQKQLLTIARAFLADPKILILDEATSSVDTRTEILIQEAMERLMKNRTSFIIAHRLSTIRNADLILVMNEGDIIEQGNHEELLKKNGFYAKLYNSQFETTTVE
ncbi:MAG TPA: ABC transporter ATP-binding protein [Mollicutes bacterium]|nr:ABC transporter ATP-binding protein [Mollicutes bacterium]